VSCVFCLLGLSTAEFMTATYTGVLTLLGRLETVVLNLWRGDGCVNKILKIKKKNFCKLCVFQIHLCSFYVLRKSAYRVFPINFRAAASSRTSRSQWPRGEHTSFFMTMRLPILQLSCRLFLGGGGKAPPPRSVSPPNSPDLAPCDFWRFPD
jgi:hypothetical protein